MEFTGKVNNIVFENNEDLFKILDVEISGELPGYFGLNIKVTGNFGEIKISSFYHFEGSLVDHPKFGPQFKCQSYQPVLPHEEGSLVKYLSSNDFPGIGKKAAEKIIDSLGLNALEVIKKDPDKILSLPLSNAQKDSLRKGIGSMDSFSDLSLKLAQLGLNKRVAAQFYKKYHEEAISKLKEDPYEPIPDITGYSFKIADQLGKDLNFELDDKRRICGAVIQIMQDHLRKNGDTYVELADLLTEANELLELNNYNLIAECINFLQQKGKIIIDNDQAYLSKIFLIESDITDLLKNLINKKYDNYAYSNEAIYEAIQLAEKELKISYDEVQKEAIVNAVKEPISILTGGPGTGKTTIINGILLCLQQLEDIPSSSVYSDQSPFLLAAPTGRAAKKMNEVTGIEAKTIHRLLGLGIDNQLMLDPEINELSGQVLIIDEMSMIDMFLFRNLLKGINKIKHIVFVGDKDQLPSVGPGNIFADLINSGTIPTTKLKQIHRQGEGNTIVNLAHAINENDNADELFKKTRNYSFIPCNPHQVTKTVGKIVNRAIERGFDPDTIQVLGAMYNGDGGINSLNDELQNVMNPKSGAFKEIKVHNESFRIGDRVLQLQNNPEKEIFNGQVGKIISLDPENSKECMVVNFDDREIRFSKKELSDLTRAYAITIHKSQGSEFSLVILDLTMQNFVMLRKNLLYTAVTRATNSLVMVGDPKAYKMALMTPGNNRKTGLALRLQKELSISSSSYEKNINTSKTDDVMDEKNDYILTPELIYSGRIDPMIGMDGIELKKR